MMDPKVAFFYVCYSSPSDPSFFTTSTYYLLLMEDVSERFAQNSTMTDIQARGLMKSLAKMHAFFWNHSCLGTIERGSFWVLERRKTLLGKFKKVDNPINFQTSIARHIYLYAEKLVINFEIFQYKHED